MLRWICEQSAILSDAKLGPSSLLPDISEEVLDEPSLSCLRKYFTEEAWTVVLHKGSKIT